MNLKISENSFRFRITPEDLENLLRGESIDRRICLGSHCFIYGISAVTQEKEMRLDMAVSGFCLFVPAAILEQLRDMGRSKNGVSGRQENVDISLQVDLKTQARNAA